MEQNHCSVARKMMDDGSASNAGTGGDVLHTHQMAALLDVLQNDLVGVPDLETGKLLARLGGQAARVVHGNDKGTCG